MAYVLERETRSGTFELFRSRSFVDSLTELVRLQRDGDQSVLRITDGALELFYRADSFTTPIVPTTSSGRFGPSQHVQVKSAVESQFETSSSGLNSVSARLVAMGYDLADLEASNPYVHGWGR